MSSKVIHAFNPVGQGLFASGTISNERRKYSWIYDCGSATYKSSNFFKQAIGTANDLCNIKGDLDTLVISHIHEDHINGIKYLKEAGIKRVRNILIPYMPIYQRFISVENLSSISAEYVEFLIDPVLFFKRLYPGAQIVLVDYAPEHLDENPKICTCGKEGIPLCDLDLKRHIGKDFPSAAALDAKMLAGQSLCCMKDFTFVFYNKRIAEYDIFYDGNAQAVDSYISYIKSSHSVEGVASAINELKSLYLNASRTESLNLNETSLVMLLKHKGLFLHSQIKQFRSCGEVKINFGKSDHLLPENRVELNDLILYSGDVNIQSDSSMQMLIDCLALKEKDVWVFQVMHHGSRFDYNAGLLDIIDPFYSVFCARPVRGYKNPRSEVIQSFSGRDTFIVNNRGVLFECTVL